MAVWIQNTIAILIVLACLGWLGLWIRNWFQGIDSGVGCASGGCGSCPSNSTTSDSKTPDNVVSIDELLSKN